MDTVTSVIGESYKAWNTQTPVLICTPTGSGKTTFVLKTLLPFAAQNGHTICYMSNRRILKQQVKNRIAPAYQGYIDITNYQAPDFSNHLYHSTYWVFDEAHYFLSDASFNKSIGKFVDHIKGAYKNHICIFMTATPQYLYLMLRYIFYNYPYVSLPNFPIPYYLDDMIRRAKFDDFKSAKRLLTYKEHPSSSVRRYSNEKFEDALERFQKNHKYDFSENVKKYSRVFEAVKERCIFYHIPHDYSYVEPCYFRDYKDLTYMIQNTPESEKWVIFTSSRTLGREIQKEILKAGIFNVAYLDASGGDDDGKDARKAIIREEAFPHRVLISTKVLDNGANISDPTVKHIVILKADETTFLQMLGRRRIDHSAHETIYLYIKHETYGSMQKFLDHKYLNILQFFYWFRFMKKEHHTSSPNQFGEYYQYPSTSGIIGRKYAEGGQFKYPYRNYVEQEPNIQEPLKRLAGDVTHPKDNVDRIVVEAYKIYTLAEQQAIYEYYKLLAMFENYQNKIADSGGRVADTMWLEEQLQWIGLTYNPQRWNTVVFGLEQDARKLLEDFLNTHQDILLQEDETQLKELVLNFLSNLRPEPKEAHSKASFSTVQTILKRYNFPYKLTKKRCSRNGKDRSWWVVTPLTADYDK